MFSEKVLYEILAERGNMDKRTDVTMFMGHNQNELRTASTYATTSYPDDESPWRFNWCEAHYTLFPINSVSNQTKAIYKVLNDFVLHPNTSQYILMVYTPVRDEIKHLLLEFEFLYEFSRNQQIITDQATNCTEHERKFSREDSIRAEIDNEAAPSFDPNERAYVDLMVGIAVYYKDKHTVLKPNNAMPRAGIG